KRYRLAQHYVVSVCALGGVVAVLPGPHLRGLRAAPVPTVLSVWHQAHVGPWERDFHGCARHKAAHSNPLFRVLLCGTSGFWPVKFSNRMNSPRYERLSSPVRPCRFFITKSCV